MRYITTEHKETAKHKQSHNAARTTYRKDNPTATRYHNVPTEFVCIDGEGITLDDGSHYYVLLGIGDQQITNPQGLGWDEICEFLWAEFQRHGSKSVAYTGFFLGYDYGQLLKNLPEERAKMLLSPTGKLIRKAKSPHRVQPFPVEYRGWEFDILGNKRLRIRKKGESRWMHICDTGPFFQKSLLKVIDPREWSDPVVSQAEYEAIARGKNRRSVAMLDNDMRIYNVLENQALSIVLGKLNEGFQTLGIHLKPSQWFGPGQAAQAWLKDRAITSKKLQEITPRDVLEAARASYYGGWFEIMAHGLIPGDTHEYDINSAYPYVISQLPCLEHGEWTHQVDPNFSGYWNLTSLPAFRKYTLVYAKVKGSDKYIGAMLHRDKDGNIFRPHITEGWYWLHEIHAARKAGLIDSIEIRESWTYKPYDCKLRLAEVAEIYKLRQKVGKKTPLGIACKLVPNSLYGKFAQSVGNPMFGNPIYASLITAGCRTLILEAIASHPEKSKAVMMIATDGVYFRSKHPTLVISGELGQWDYERKRHMCLFKPGVYWDDKARYQIKTGETPVFKARGVNARDFATQIMLIDNLFRDGAAEEGLWPSVTFPISFSMVTPVQALARNKWELAGTLITGDNAMVKQSSAPWKKRCNPYKNGDILRSKPRVNDPYEISYPYEKRFGLDDPFSDENMEAHGVTEEGLPGMLIREGLGLA
jgi:hypothetical protein